MTYLNRLRYTISIINKRGLAMTGCKHEILKVEKETTDFGKETFAICQDCGEDRTSDFNWDSYYDIGDVSDQENENV